jgi:tellurite resistance protein TerC
MMNLHLFEVLFLLACFILDCFLFFKFKRLSFKGALINFGFWTAVALGFFASLYFGFNEVKATEFLAGYILERTLSLDNIFVFYIIFNFFKISTEAKQRVLFWGIIIAIILRFLFIFIGAELVSRFYFLMYLFGLFLLFTGLKLLFAKEGNEDDFSNNIIVRICKKILPTTNKTKGDDFTMKIDGKIFFTPVFLVMVLVGFTDLIFALDSIPAIFGITLDPFIVMTANFFSLMGLRAIFFLIAEIIKRFYYIKYALSAILVFIGVKMLIAQIYHISTFYSLLFILGSIGLSILVSLVFKKDARGA